VRNTEMRMNTLGIQGFGDRVHRRLVGLGYVKRDKPDVSRFCRERDYRPQYVYAWLKGRLPRAGYLERLAGDLQVSPAWLMFGEQSAQMAEVRASMAWGAGAAPAPLRPQPPRAVPSGGRSAHAARATPPLGPRLIDFRRLRELTQQLSQVEAQLEGVFRAFPDRYLWLDPDGKVLSCNGPDEDGSIVGKGLLEVFPPEAGQLLHDALHRARQTGDLATIEYAVREAADERVYEARFVPLGDPATTRLQVLLFVRDLTERKRLEARLRDRDRAYVSLLCNLSSMAYRRRNDERWTMALVSDGCLALTGHAAPELSGNRVVAFAALIHPEDRQRVSEKCQASLEARVPCSSEYRIVTAAGEEKWVWDQAQGVYGPSGEILAVEGLVTDITQRKRAEEIAAALGDVGREMAGTLDFAEATEAMVTAVLRLFRVRRAVLWRLDPETGLWVEEVKPRDVHLDLERVALAGLREPLETRDERDAAPAGALRRQSGLLILGGLDDEGLDDFFQGHGLSGDVEVDIDLRAHVLADVADDRHPAVLVRLAKNGGVLHVLGSYPDHDPAALETSKSRASLEGVWV